MGLAASQAKLLSITSRLSDNEMRSQTITAAKMALANQSSEASRKYINALNTNEYIYGTYDEVGNKVYTALTGNQITTYGPLKNQYAIINTAGQVLVSETDATNYENSENINEFLQKYGVESIPTGKSKKVTNPEYEVAYEQWLKDIEAWHKLEPDINDYMYLKTVDDSYLYQVFKTASKSCYDNATGSSKRHSCYLHVLAHMLDLELDPNNPNNPDVEKYISGQHSYETSIPGWTISFDYTCISGSAIHANKLTSAMLPISEALTDGYKGNTVYAAEHEDDTLTMDSSDVEKLLSNYTFDENGDKVLKTMKQKCIDLYYAVEQCEILGIDYDTTMINKIKEFDKDLQVAFKEKAVKDEYYEYLKEWQDEKPEMEDIPATIEEEIYEYTDKDKAQWYVNLWHRMNGGSQEKDGTESTSITTAETDASGNYTSTKLTTTTTSRTRYDILEDGLMNSQDWLKYALETGAVSMERVNFAEKTEENTGLLKAEWTSIIYTNALDISEQTSEKKIAQAEAEYEQKQREIENKDKQYDSMLKLLDTEHTALQTEYDSVKTVITKNTERTLKIYSA